MESGAKLPDLKDYLYWTLCTASTPNGRKLPKTTQEMKEFLGEVMKEWHPALKLLFDEALRGLSACIPVVSSKPDIEFPSSPIQEKRKGKVTLLGDAAHAMSPMGESGADTAILNAVDLTETIGKCGVTEYRASGWKERMSVMAEEKIEHSFRGDRYFGKGNEGDAY